MLTFLGFAAILALLALILFRVTSVLVALTLVPVAAGIAAGFGGQIGAFAMEGIRSVTPTGFARAVFAANAPREIVEEVA